MIAANITKILQEIPQTVKLVAVSKTKPNEALMEAYEAGQRAFGENKVQELVLKHEQLPKDIEWHMIGHLQSNKVKYIAPFIGLIHSVDSLKLLETIDKEAAKNNRVIDCLLQFYIAAEETKFGLDLEEAHQLLSSSSYQTMHHIRIVGVMGMASFSDDEQIIRTEFRLLKSYFKVLKETYFKGDNNADFSICSFGMSGDYAIAIEEGSNMVRVGSTIFGDRHTQI
jgi:PLP dependent protein